jgi:hypothetical protein
MDEHYNISYLDGSQANARVSLSTRLPCSTASASVSSYTGPILHGRDFIYVFAEKNMINAMEKVVSRTPKR